MKKLFVLSTMHVPCATIFYNFSNEIFGMQWPFPWELPWEDLGAGVCVYVLSCVCTSLNPVLDASVYVFDGTYYKITITNYISKTSIYTTFRMYPWGPWPLKILMFALLVTREIATSSWPWDSNIQLTVRKDWRRQIYVGFVADIDIKILGVPPLGPGMPFLNSNTCAGGGGWLFISAGVFFPVRCHLWMDDETNG